MRLTTIQGGGGERWCYVPSAEFRELLQMWQCLENGVVLSYHQERTPVRFFNSRLRPSLLPLFSFSTIPGFRGMKRKILRRWEEDCRRLRTQGGFFQPNFFLPNFHVCSKIPRIVVSVLLNKTYPSRNFTRNHLERHHSCSIGVRLCWLQTTLGLWDSISLTLSKA